VSRNQPKSGGGRRATKNYGGNIKRVYLDKNKTKEGD